jgi:predicted alpha/beta hydrolase family esterase
VSEQRPLSFDFAMMASGFRSDSAIHSGLFAARDSFALPSLHMMSQYDPIVATRDSRALAEQFQAPLVLEHASGHVVASTPPIREQVARFLTKMHHNSNPLHDTGVITS